MTLHDSRTRSDKRLTGSRVAHRIKAVAKVTVFCHDCYMIDPRSAAAGSAGRVLIVDADPATSQLLTQALEAQRYQVWLATSAADGERLLDVVQPDVLLLDLMLPDVDGLVFCSQLRPRWTMPVILMSEGRRRTDRVLGLRLGADDFVAKPFDIHELVARVEVALRRRGGIAPTRATPGATGREATSFGALTINRSRRFASVGNRSLALTPTEFQILSLMASRPGEVFSRAELTNVLWGLVDGRRSRAIDVHIRRLRGKLDALPDAPVITTVWGHGYKLDLALAS